MMNTVRPEATGGAAGALAPMTLHEFIRNFELPPIVPIKRACEVEQCSVAKIYKERKEGRLRIVPRTAGTGIPVTDLYARYVQAHAPDAIGALPRAKVGGERR
jgi:hypothetical protein